MLIRTNIYLFTETLRYYKQQAKLKGTTLAQEIRTVLEADKKNQKGKKPHFFDRILDDVRHGEVKYKNKKIPTDISSRIDDYLYKEPYERRGSI